MALRVLVFAGAYGAALVPRLAPAVVAMALASLAAAGVLARRGAPTPAPAPATIATLTNPFNLRAALSFGLLYALVLLLLPAAQRWLGGAGTFAAAAAASLVDVDAMAIALARGTPATGATGEAAAAIALGVTTNTLVKAGIVVVLARGNFRRWVLAGLVLGAVVCAATALALYHAA